MKWKSSYLLNTLSCNDVLYSLSYKVGHWVWIWVGLTNIFGSSPSQLAATVAAHCPGRMAEHPKSKSTGGFHQQDGSPCTVYIDRLKVVSVLQSHSLIENTSLAESFLVIHKRLWKSNYTSSVFGSMTKELN